MQVFSIAPAGLKPLWVLLPVGLVLAVVVSVLALSVLGSRSARFEVSAAGLELRGDVYGRFIPAESLRIDAARRVDLTRDSELLPRRRTMGTGLPGYQSGWFRLANGESALLYLTDRGKAVHVPTTVGYSLLISPDDPDGFVSALQTIRKRWTRMSVFSNPANRSSEQATSYTAAVLGLLGSEDPMRVLQDTPSALGRAIDGLDTRQLSRPEAAGKWSIAQVLQHLADSELVCGYRLRMVLAHDRPSITGYDQDLWATRLRYEDAEPQQAIHDFTVLREANLRLLSRASSDDLTRVGIHAERGEESVAHMIRLYAGHDVLHLKQIERIRQTVA